MYWIEMKNTARCHLPRILFDGFVSEREQPGRYFDAEDLGDLEVDHELDLGRLQDRKIGRLHTLENLSNINAGLTKGIAKIGAIAHQSTGYDVLAQWIHGRYPIAGRQRDDLVLPANQKTLSGDDQCVNLMFGHRRKTDVDLPHIASGKNNKLLTKAARSGSQVCQLVFHIRVGRVCKRGDHGHARQELV